METTLDRQFLDFSTQKLRQYTSEIQKCLSLLVLHLCGNVRQRIAAIAGHGRVRERVVTREGLGFYKSPVPAPHV